LCIELATPRDRLSPKPLSSAPKKKSKTTFGTPVNDSKEDEKQTCLDDIGGRGGKELEGTAT
jgi:hypothetical protein